MKLQNDKNELLNAAIAYARQGWAVIPLHTVVGGRCSCNKQGCKIGKHPLISNWPEKASTDTVTIWDWWTKWPNANIGILTGSVSNLMVLDIDLNNGGMDSFKRLEEKYGTLPYSRRVKTGGGGFHIYFKHPGAYVKSAIAIARGIDIRADKSYVVAPPSVHKSGELYQWEENTI
jgi:putative DNA primase/helicase